MAAVERHLSQVPQAPTMQEDHSAMLEAWYSPATCTDDQKLEVAAFSLRSRFERCAQRNQNPDAEEAAYFVDKSLVRSNTQEDHAGHEEKIHSEQIKMHLDEIGKQLGEIRSSQRPLKLFFPGHLRVREESPTFQFFLRVFSRKEREVAEEVLMDFGDREVQEFRDHALGDVDINHSAVCNAPLPEQYQRALNEYRVRRIERVYRELMQAYDEDQAESQHQQRPTLDKFVFSKLFEHDASLEIPSGAEVQIPLEPFAPHHLGAARASVSTQESQSVVMGVVLAILALLAGMFLLVCP